MTETVQKARAEEPNGAASTMPKEEEQGDNVENKLPAGERLQKRMSVTSAESKDSKAKSPKKRRKVNHGMTRVPALTLFRWDG